MSKVSKGFILSLLLLTNSVIFSQNDKITVYFNKWVDNNASSIIDAQRVIDIDDTIISYINRAEYSIDFCVYNTSNIQIVSALNNAYDRGISVRYIHDNSATNSAVSGLNSNINRISNSSSGIMHNKYLVIDIEDAQKTQLITGSVNFTYQNMFEDYNNLIIIQDNDIAQCYKDEFNEMWGSTSLTPNASESKFGNAKSDNTPHFFNVNGTDIEVYFSPTDNVTSKIESTINSADYQIEFALLYFTRSDLSSAVITKHNAGIEVKGLMEKIDEAWGSEYQTLLDNNVDVHSYLDEPGMLHHKYLIVDPNNSSSDPLVLTGSHNWSTSAETKNDENTIIIHDVFVANEFLEEFTSRYNQVTSIDEINSQILFNVLETSEHINISSEKVFNASLFSSSGKLLNIYKNKLELDINKSTFEKGLYILQINDNKTYKSIKFIIN